MGPWPTPWEAPSESVRHSEPKSRQHDDGSPPKTTGILRPWPRRQAEGVALVRALIPCAGVIAHHQRQRILDGAAKAIAKQGYRQASVADIVRERRDRPSPLLRELLVQAGLLLRPLRRGDGGGPGARRQSLRRGERASFRSRSGSASKRCSATWNRIGSWRGPAWSRGRASGRRSARDSRRWSVDSPSCCAPVAGAPTR